MCVPYGSEHLLISDNYNWMLLLMLILCLSFFFFSFLFFSSSFFCKQKLIICLCSLDVYAFCHSGCLFFRFAHLRLSRSLCWSFSASFLIIVFFSSNLPATCLMASSFHVETSQWNRSSMIH